jgi:hypothetical protein
VKAASVRVDFRDGDRAMDADGDSMNRDEAEGPRLSTLDRTGSTRASELIAALEALARRFGELATPTPEEVCSGCGKIKRGAVCALCRYRAMKAAERAAHERRSTVADGSGHGTERAPYNESPSRMGRGRARNVSSTRQGRTRPQPNGPYLLYRCAHTGRCLCEQTQP